MSKKEDLTGNKYGKLTVKEMLYNHNGKGRTKCLCECECGNTCVKLAYELKRRKPVSEKEIERSLEQKYELNRKSNLRQAIKNDANVIKQAEKIQKKKHFSIELKENVNKEKQKETNNSKEEKQKKLKFGKQAINKVDVDDFEDFNW